MEMSYPSRSMYPPFPQKSVCMSMTMSAVFSGRRSPSYGHGYGFAATNVMCGLLSPSSSKYGQLRRHVGGRLGRRARRDHDDQREHVGRRVEQVVAPGDSDGLQRRSDGARAA